MNPFTKTKRPRRASGKEAGKITPQAWNGLVDYCEELEKVIRSIIPKASPDILPKLAPGGVTFSLARRPGSAGGSACPFGRLKKTVSGETVTISLVGGAVTAGATVHTVDDYDLDLGNPGTFVLWIETAFVGNMADGLVLPGIASSASCTIEIGASYPSQSIPNVAGSAAGTSIVPLGALVIASGRATFSPSGCGDVIISHCPGSVNYERA